MEAGYFEERTVFLTDDEGDQHLCWNGPESRLAEARDYAAVGIDIPPGFDLAPICGLRACLDPAHLEVIPTTDLLRSRRLGG